MWLDCWEIEFNENWFGDLCDLSMLCVFVCNL